MAKEIRDLKNIKLNEVSIAGTPANEKEFLFAKQKKFKIEIDSDGTIGGTNISLDGEDIGSVQSFNFSVWNDTGRKASDPVNCSYTKFVEDGSGFKRSENYYLAKGVKIMNGNIKKMVQDYFGEDEKIDFEKQVEFDDKAVESAMAVICKYKPEFTNELTDAVGAILKQASTGIVVDLAKSGARFSKDTLEKIKKVIAALKELEGMVPGEDDKGVQKSDDTALTAATEQLNKALEKITALEKNVAGSEKESEVVKAVQALTARIDAIEKKTSVKKGIQGQDDTEDLSKGNEEAKWPSISGSK
jgi:hypothetical protein